MKMLSGTLLNFAAILVGSFIGLTVRWLSNRFGGTLPAGSACTGERSKNIVMQGISLCVMYIGFTGCLKGKNSLITILSMVFGALIGELLDLNARMQRLGDWVQKKTEHLLRSNVSSPSVSEGFVTTALLFCVGAMAIVGPLENGLTGHSDTLQAKSLLDCISSVVFSSSLGIGVPLSAFAVLIYQGTIALLASVISPLLGAEVIAEITCVGSLLIVALSLNMLGLTKIKIMNLVPAIFFPVLLCLFL